MSRTPYALRARRLLAILHLFEPDTEIPLEAIATAVGATPAEVESDLDLLSCCGTGTSGEELVPIYVEDGRLVVFNPMPSLDRAVRLSAREARALVTALETAGLGTSDELLTRLMQAAAAADVTAEELERVVHASSASAEVLPALSRALEERAPVRITYHGVGRGGSSERVVEPIGLLNERGAWYLEAFCRTAGALRTFRVDRLRAATILPGTFGPRDLSPAGTAFVSTGLPLARIRLDAGEEVSSREWSGMRVVEQTGDGGLVVDVPFAGTGWLARQVAARLGAAQVITPPELREAVAVLAGELARG